MSSLDSKLIVVTGAATDGIGTAVTRRLLGAGFTVVGSYESSEKKAADELLAEYPSLLLTEVDHADRSSLDGLVRALPDTQKLFALINAQFFFAMERPNDFDFALWDRSLAVNLSAPNYLYHRLRPRFEKGGSIVTITSTEAFVGSFGATAYAATKAAIHNLTKSLANNSSDLQVRVNAVAAGWIGGVMDTDEVFNMSRAITPLGRLGRAEEIADVVLFLTSSAASFINGSVIVADDGYSGVDTIAKYEFESQAAPSLGQ